VKISAKTEYACIAMLELSEQFASGEPVRIREIADEHGIPSRFLVQILLQLKGVGLVTSTRGASGGYRLLRSPEQITLSEVMEAIDGPLATASNLDTASPLSRALHSAWTEASEAQAALLSGITFADLVASAAKANEPMYYI